MMKIKQWNSSVRKVSSVGVTSIDTSTWTEPRKRLSKDENGWVFELERERLEHMSTLELMYWAALLCQPTWYFYSTDWTYKRGSRDKMSLQDTEVRITCQTLDLSNECLLSAPEDIIRRATVDLTGNQVLGIHYLVKIRHVKLCFDTFIQHSTYYTPFSDKNSGWTSPSPSISNCIINSADTFSPLVGVLKLYYYTGCL